MARPSRCRRICAQPNYNRFVPVGYECPDKVTLSVDEYEVIRLVDLEKLTHEQCARQMDISRTTVTEIYEAAREKVADVIVNGKPLEIAGGNYRICDGVAAGCCRKRCVKTGGTVLNQTVQMKGANEMRIAVTYENGRVFQHFGHTEQFKIYDVADGKITGQQVIDTNGSGHGALAGFLAGLGVDVLICGGIGGGAKNALEQAKIQLYGGVSGQADEAVRALLDGKLDYNPDVHCNHHGHHGEHNQCGHHGQHEHHGQCGHHDHC